LGSGFGSGASRLVSGNSPEYKKLEKLLAGWKKTEAALVFPTGYKTNLGVISTLMKNGDIIIIDKLCHASIIDGCRLSGADLRVYKHCDLPNLKNIMETIKDKYQKKLIVTESVFSMDGDIAPLAQIVRLAKKYQAWTMVDEAHGIGVFGNTGAGVLEKENLSGQVDIIIGTLSKAIGGIGGYVTGSRLLIDYLINKARPFIYTTGLPEEVVKKDYVALKKLIEAKAQRKKLWQNIEYFYDRATHYNLPINKPTSAIIPIIIGEEKKTVKLSQKLLKQGFNVPAIRYPTVAKNSARLRITLTAEHTKPEIEALIKFML
jgi:8-amino-7-oxononanoate synthase